MVITPKKAGLLKIATGSGGTFEPPVGNENAAIPTEKGSVTSELIVEPAI